MPVLNIELKPPQDKIQEFSNTFMEIQKNVLMDVKKLTELGIDKFNFFGEISINKFNILFSPVSISIKSKTDISEGDLKDLGKLLFTLLNQGKFKGLLTTYFSFYYDPKTDIYKKIFSKTVSSIPQFNNLKSIYVKYGDENKKTLAVDYAGLRVNIIGKLKTEELNKEKFSNLLLKLKKECEFGA